MYMSVIMTWVVVLFWIVGVATGIVSAIFFLELEEEYIFQPVKQYTAKIRKRFTKIISTIPVSSRRALRILWQTRIKPFAQKM